MAEKCSDIKGLMHGALDGELGVEERTRFDEHLAACPRCRREYEALTRAVAVFAAAPRLEPSLTFAADVMRRARDLEAGRRRALSWVVAGAAAAAGAGAVALWGGFLGPALVSTAARAAAGLAATAADGWKMTKILVVGADAVGTVLSAFGRAGSLLVWEGVKISSPAYVGAFAAIGLLYLLWRAGSRAAPSQVISI